MGHIQWNALDVSNGMDEVERRVNEAAPLLEEGYRNALPFLQQAIATVEGLRQLPKVPQYMDGNLQLLRWNLERLNTLIEYTVKSCHGDIRVVRDAIPEDALARERVKDPQMALMKGGE